MHVHIRRTKWVSGKLRAVDPVSSEQNCSPEAHLILVMLEPTEAALGCYWFNQTLTGEIRWLETSIIKQRSITRTPPNLIALRPNITAKAITQRARSTQQTPSNIRRMLANTANKRMQESAAKMSIEVRLASGLYF